MSKKLKLSRKMQLYLEASLILGILLVAVNIAIYLVDIYAGGLLSLFAIIYFAVIIVLFFYNKKLIFDELISFATQYGQVQKRLLRELELPHALMDEKGRIVWTNHEFEKITEKKKGYRKSITTIFPGIQPDKFPIDSSVTEMDVEYGERYYHVKMKRVDLNEMFHASPSVHIEDYQAFLTAIYLFDETALRYALQENDDQSLAVGLIYLDNFEEALNSVEEVRRALLIALIDRKVNKYISAIDGIVKKLEKDKYIVVLRKKALLQLEEKRFELLEDVKTVNIGDEMSMTLSIGIGLGGLSYSQNYEYARSSIDLALARGGDQAVIKNADSISYFGGKSQQIEKSTRVKARVKAQAMKEIIDGKDKVLIMGHRLTDVDSFGAAIGVYCVSRALEKPAHIIIDHVSTSVKNMLSLFTSNSEYPEDMFLTSSQALAMVDNSTVLVVVDVNKPSITEAPEVAKECKTTIVIDHHRQGTEVFDNPTLSYVEPYASSACEMVSEILQYVSDNVKVKGIEADCMYSGIMIDTNGFVAKTGVRTFEAAAYLRRNGADVTRVRKMFREDPTEYIIKAKAVSQAELYKDSYAISIVKGEKLVSPTIVGAQAANELLNIKGIKASFIFTEFQNKIYISARSIDEVNVQIITERLGGGGHMNIAGAQIEDCSVEEAIQMLKETLDDMEEEGAI